MIWIAGIYFGSLCVLLLSAFWDTNPFTAEVVHELTLDNFRTIFEREVYRDVAWRTIRMAALVTVADAVLAFPIAPVGAMNALRASREPMPAQRTITG